MAVEAVACYRCAKSEPVCTVNAQLVGASGVRKQLYQRASCCLSDNLIVGYGSLSVVGVHLLIRAVKRVGDEWQTYPAACWRIGCAVEQCHIALADASLAELLLQVLVCLWRLGKYYQSRCVHVEAVNGHRLAAFGIVLAYQRCC